jgi:hypothetical protein
VLFLLFLWTRARALKSRVAELVDAAALRAGLQRVARKQKIARPVAAAKPKPAMIVTDPAAPNLPG